MKMNAWMRVGAIGFAASLFVAGCVVNSTSDNGDGGTATGGTGGTATGGTGGTATGGSGGTTTGGSGGTAGGNAGGAGGGFTCQPDAGTATCDSCMQTTCCSDWETCQNNAECISEFACIKTCTDNAIKAINSDAGADAGDPSKIVANCAAQCTPADAGSILPITSNLVGCARSTDGGASCGLKCFGGY